ncbi:MAG: nuclear transport factor 2 family protein [Saonia sp.]
MKKLVLVFIFSMSGTIAVAQSEIDLIQKTLNKYIEGTAQGNRTKLNEAFQEGFQLFLVAGDTLRIIDGKQYIQNVEPGKTYKRIAQIVSVDYENDTALGKIEVFFPDRKQVATDYLLLLKGDNGWKIVHKIINLKSTAITEELPEDESSNITKLNATLLDYIEGTANGQLSRIHKAFQKGFNLYYVKEGTITILEGEKYLGNFKEGKKNNRIGKVLGVDFEGDAAFGKVEVRMPERERRVIDYLLLLKIEGDWKIIHKSFTTQNYKI